MKYLVILFLIIAAVALMYLKKAYRTQIALGFLGLLAFLSLILSVRSLPSTVPLTRTFNQLFYQENVQDENYFDAILPLMVGGKTIYTKNDFNHLTFDMSDPEAPWELHLKEIYYGVNSRNILQAMDAKVVEDPALNGVEIKGAKKDAFDVLGQSNDLYRFSFAANDIPEEYGNYFHYYYYYTGKGTPMHIYIHADDPADFTPDGNRELVAIWQPLEEGNGEDLFLMTREYYDREVAP